MTELEQQTDAAPTLAIVPVGGDPLAVVDDLDSRAIIESLAGKVSETWVYEFKQGAGTVVGLTHVGVDQAARYMATKGEALRIIDCHIEYEDDREARFFAIAGRYAVNADGRQIMMDTATGAKRQPKYMRLKNGGEKFNENWYEIGNTKACRNAKAKLIADEVRQHIIAEARGQKGRTAIVREQEPRKGSPSAPAPEAAPASGDNDGSELGKLRHQAGKAFKDFAELRGMMSAIEYVTAMNANAIADGNLKLGALSADDCKELIDAAYAATADTASEDVAEQEAEPTPPLVPPEVAEQPALPRN